MSLMVLGCAQDIPERTPTPTPQPVPFDAQAALKRSGEVMAALESFHFRLHHERGRMELLPGLMIEEAEGDVVKPDKLFITYNASIGERMHIRGSVITLGDAGYVTNPITGNWEAGPPGVSSAGFFDPSAGINSMMSDVTGVQLLERAGDGRPNHRLRGTLPAESLAPLVGKTVEGSVVEVELTIDPLRSHLIEARFSGKVTPSDSADTVRLITLSAFNEAISIKAPL